MNTSRYFPRGWTIWTLLAIATTGILICLSKSGGGTGTLPDKPWEVTGALLFIPSLLLLSSWLLIGFCRSLRDEHERWISQFPPAKQQQIRNAERLALFMGALGVAEVMHHERHKAAQHRQQVASERLAQPTDTVNVNPAWNGRTWV